MNKSRQHNPLTSFFYNKTKLRLVGLFLLLVVLMFLFLPMFENFLSIEENIPSLDKPYMYSPDEVFEVLTGWGEDGRIKQFQFHITWDILLPGVYFFFLGFLIAWLTKRGFRQNSKWQNLCLLSSVAVIDVLENITLFLLILVYPSKIDILSWLKTGLTLIKYYIFGPAILSALFFSGIHAGKNRFT